MQTDSERASSALSFLKMSLLSLGVAIIRNKGEEEVGRRTVPRGEHAAVFSNALKRFTDCLGLLNVYQIHK